MKDPEKMKKNIIEQCFDMSVENHQKSQFLRTNLFAAKFYSMNGVFSPIRRRFILFDSFEENIFVIFFHLEFLKKKC